MQEEIVHYYNILQSVKKLAKSMNVNIDGIIAEKNHQDLMIASV